MKKRDLFLGGGICLAAGILWLVLHFLLPGNYSVIRITVDGELFGEYSLAEEQTIEINDTNVCRIEDGKVKMTEADCPDHLCIHQKAVDAAGGSIVCLPNRVVIESAERSSAGQAGDGLDAVTF